MSHHSSLQVVVLGASTGAELSAFRAAPQVASSAQTYAAAAAAAGRLLGGCRAAAGLLLGG